MKSKIYSKEQINMDWTCNADWRREDTQGSAPHKNGRKNNQDPEPD